MTAKLPSAPTSNHLRPSPVHSTVISSNKALAYALLRIALGVNFAGHGLIRIHNGIGAFASTTAEHMAKSPLPHGFVLGFGYAIPSIEVLLGLGPKLIAQPLAWGRGWRSSAGAVFRMGAWPTRKLISRRRGCPIRARSYRGRVGLQGGRTAHERVPYIARSDEWVPI